MKFQINNETYVTLEDVEKMIDLKRTSISMLVRFCGFPKPEKIEIRKAWKLSDIEEYIEKSKK